jgi:hypothetical protein
MKSHNTQAFKLLKDIHPILQTEPISLEKDILKRVTKKSFLKVEANELIAFLKDKNRNIKAKLFFHNGYFFLKNREFLEKNNNQKLKKDEFILQTSTTFVPFDLGQYILQKGVLECEFISRYEHFNAKLYYHEAFFIKIEGSK